MNRRTFLQTSGKGALSFMGASVLPNLLQKAIAAVPPLRITKVETVRFSPQLQVEGRGIQWMWVRLHTNEGIIGTGETYPFNEASGAVIKDLEWHSWAGKLLGSNPLEIEQTWERIYRQNAYHVTGGAEMRALSAINLAQWDILGQAANMPVYQLLGGSANKDIRVYNTYTNARNINGWTLENDMEKIASFLVEEGIQTIKFCPFDIAGSRTNGEYISKKEIEASLDWIRRVRDTVGYELEIGCEFHSKWNLPSAVRIAQSLEPFEILFLEDMLLQDNMQAYATLAAETPIPLALSERLATRFGFREMFEAKLGGIAMYDLTWCGGISEGKKISDMANTYYVPTMMHTAGGPILWYASVQLAAAISNLFYVESVHPNWKNRYPYFFENVPQVNQGRVQPPEASGLGLVFREGLFESNDVIVETIAEE
ncbi:mandelate racemase/muconate lactonizing enzyme family protein [Catalinimonas sp. 4WD22]|uniref:mandelate racemase/muconate lactonizing enzyme family protein n=1 Tax=Catalinimonas locisalis TaxID=3133978 RepID=UPI0031013133